jgi:hypothetical protein
MARKPQISEESLTALGLPRLAQMIVDEAAANAAFRKTVNAALASLKGPAAVAALVDRRLSALARARGVVDWEKARAFTADLRATLKTVTDELARIDAAMAAERLLAFIATSRSVFERADDSNGSLQRVYEDAIAGLDAVARAMPEKARRNLPEQVMEAMARDEQGYLDHVVAAVAHHVPRDALAAWDARLAAGITALPAPKNDRDWQAQSARSRLDNCRKQIAIALGDIDGLIAIESAKAAHTQDAFGIAEMLLVAGRAEEALVWARKRAVVSPGYMRRSDVADDTGIRSFNDERAIRLEARVLDELGRRDEARALRWTVFTNTFSAEVLREYMKSLGDFEEFDAMDKAFAMVLGSKDVYRALEFLMEWPDMKRAAAHVLAHRAKWDGRHYDLLAPAAADLEHESPAAAAVLCRALLDDILTRARSAAYGHGARYLKRLDAMADAIAADGLETQAAYRDGLQKAHGRKAAFWSLLK